MSDLAALSAQLVDVRNVGQHKCIKLTLHVAAEQAGLVMAAFGWPTMVDPVPVAIARLNPETEVMPAASSKSNVDTPPASGPDIQARARKPVDPKKRLAQRAGILCNDTVFHAYLRIKHKALLETTDPFVVRTEIAADFVRQFCKVKSRSEIINGTEAGLRWELLESAFVAWRDVPEYADA